MTAGSAAVSSSCSATAVGSTSRGPIDLAATENGRFVYVLSALDGQVDAFATQRDGGLVPAGVTSGLPTIGADGGPEGIVAFDPLISAETAKADAIGATSEEQKAALAGALLLGERPTAVGALGCAMILGGAVAVEAGPAAALPAGNHGIWQAASAVAEFTHQTSLCHGGDTLRVECTRLEERSRNDDFEARPLQAGAQQRQSGVLGQAA